MIIFCYSALQDLPDIFQPKKPRESIGIPFFPYAFYILSLYSDKKRDRVTERDGSTYIQSVSHSVTPWYSHQ